MEFESILLLTFFMILTDLDFLVFQWEKYSFLNFLLALIEKLLLPLYRIAVY